jgi:hypothetical protein
MIKISTRVVFVFKKFVIKFPIDKRGYLQGKNEKKMWDKYGHTNILGKLIWERFGIVCMKRYPIANRIPNYVVACAKDYIPEFDIDRCDLYKIENWGKDENSNPILIDYGINEDISKMY